MSRKQETRGGTSVGDGTAMAGTAGDMELRDVSLSFGSVSVFSHASAVFDSGRVHVITGPSGAGKTTLLRLLLGLEEPNEGEILRPVGMCFSATFQEDRLCDNLTATANIRMPHGRLKGEELEEFLAVEREALAAVGMPDVEGRPVRDFSGGQRRRVAILRCALADADAYMFDEPLKGMDEETISRVMSYVLPKLSGRCVLWVTHDERELAFFDDPVLWSVADGGVRRRAGDEIRPSV